MKNVNEVHVHRYDEDAWTVVNESIAAETLVHLRVNGKPVSVSYTHLTLPTILLV